MTTKERLHKLIDELPDSEIEPVAEILASRCNDPAGETIGEAWRREAPVR